MAKAKRKTLPKDFEVLLKGGDFAKITAVLEECEIDARGGSSERTALAFDDCSDELSRWLVARGADVDAPDRSGNSPLQNRTTYRGRVDVLIELGANVHHANGSGGTPLHTAAERKNLAVMEKLLAAGAKVDAPNKRGMTALELMILGASNADLLHIAPIVRRLLAAGAEERPSMAAAVKRLGEQFEFHRAGFHKESLPVASAALEELYEIFDVPPVPRRLMHDGVTPIVVPPGSWQEQHAALWELLVPSSGAARTVQGELIRISGKIDSEMRRNGGANWDDGFRAMCRAFVEHVQTGTALLDSDVASLRQSLRGEPNDAEREELHRMAVRWVQWNPKPVPLPPPEYKR